MSLVAYGSSDESSDEEENNSDINNKNETVIEIATIQQTSEKLCLPAPKNVENSSKNDVTTDSVNTNSSEKIHFDKLPKPKSLITEEEDMIEEDDIPLKKEAELKPERLIKKDRAPVKITVPSLSDFKDLEEENEVKANKIKPSNKGTKLFALLPPPKGVELKSTNNLVPTIVNKAAAKINRENVSTNKGTKNDSRTNKVTKTATTKISMDISSDSEGEDDAIVNSNTSSATDFFALSATETISDPIVSESIENDTDLKQESHNYDSEIKDDSKDICINNIQKTLVSNIMNLPKEEILLKNKAEVGPKLPVPEQEYNIDTEGNVAFDDKAIEYLCGRRGVKRKPREIEELNIIEINGEDIKPDEREWLVKALTEEPVQRPVSMQGGGVNSQSKKKHQITYLAHQAKAMEMELKNQWAQNRLTRKQTQSKYGF